MLSPTLSQVISLLSLALSLSLSLSFSPHYPYAPLVGRLSLSTRINSTKAIAKIVTSEVTENKISEFQLFDSI